MNWLARLFQREHTSESPPGTHLFDVIQCQPHERPASAGETMFGGTVKTPAMPGTLILMRCRCGIWKTEWIPGVWTVSDFHRTEPENMDRVITALSEEKKP